MLRGFYLASTGLINQQRTINTISNNVANSQTAGFKSDLSVQNTFKRELILLNHGRKNTTGTIEYKYTEESYTHLAQGSFEFTGRPLDVAIEGDVYFNIRTPDGVQCLTRNGQFNIDDEGYLSLVGVGRVLSANGEIYVGTSDFQVTNTGEIILDGQSLGNLSLTYIEEGTTIQKIDDNLFVVPEGEQTDMPANVNYEIIQGAFERSNVDTAVEMTRAMAAQRSFEAISSALKMIDTINQSAATQLGKI